VNEGGVLTLITASSALCRGVGEHSKPRDIPRIEVFIRISVRFSHRARPEHYETAWLFITQIMV
jgi:hypothetical protein